MDVQASWVKGREYLYMRDRILLVLSVLQPCFFCRSVVSENVKTAEDTHSDSDSSIQTASDVDTHKTDASIAEEVPGELADFSSH